MKYYTGCEESISFKEVNTAVEAAFAEHGRGAVQMPPKVYITLPKGDFRTMPAYLPALKIAGMKIVNVHPDNRSFGLPTVMAVTVILDIDTGRPEAVINATGLTDMRTGAAGAVAARHLSSVRRIILGVIGSGRQAQAQVDAISEVLEITEIRVWSRTPRNAEAFAQCNASFGARSVPIEEACDCDVLVTTTPATTPLVKSEWVHEGTHINAIGADAPGKQELEAGLLKRAEVFVDDIDQAVHSGEINVPISRGLFMSGDLAGTLGEVVLGKKRRSSPDAITIFDSTGLAIQDLAIAEIAMRKGSGTDLPFP